MGSLLYIYKDEIYSYLENKYNYSKTSSNISSKNELNQQTDENQLKEQEPEIELELSDENQLKEQEPEIELELSDENQLKELEQYIDSQSNQQSDDNQSNQQSEQYEQSDDNQLKEINLLELLYTETSNNNYIEVSENTEEKTKEKNKCIRIFDFVFINHNYF